MSTPARLRVLCVDDEPQVLEGLRPILSRRYELTTATGGTEALEVLQQQPLFAVIVSDMRMPGLNGAQFLAQSRRYAPDAQRILLTGQTDLAAAIAAVNEGEIFRFLSKPCPAPELLAVVDEAASRYQARLLERTNLRRKVEYQQLRIDPMSGLASRLEFMERLEALAAEPSAPGAIAAYLIEVERSGSGSDPMADESVSWQAEQLRQYARDAVCIARWGIRQFALLLPTQGVGDLDLHVWGAGLREALLASPPQHGVRLEAYIGIARLLDPRQWQSLMASAAVATREARRDATARVCINRPEVPLEAEREQELQRSLRGAVDDGQISLHYQPIVDVSRGYVRSIECLARWRHPTLGAIAPTNFIAVAEQSGDIVWLGQWLLQRACQEGRAWCQDGKRRLSVNVSALQLVDPQFMVKLRHCLSASGLEPLALELELTETALARDLAQVREVLQQVRRLGVQVAVDDFGTGYSSLSYLSQLPIDAIKIDRAFVRDFDQGGRTILSAALTIGHDFGREVVVEGVETAQMAQQAQSLGARLLQGYWFARPMAAAAMTRWLHDFEAPPGVQEGAQPAA